MSIETGVQSRAWTILAQVGGSPRGKFYRVKHPESNSILIARTIRGRIFRGPELCNPDQVVANVIARFEQDGESYVVYDVPACFTLHEVLKTSLIPFERGFKIALQVADALRCIHRSGRVHGLLSTEAVLLFSDDRIATIDYSSSELWGVLNSPEEIAYLDPTLPSPSHRDESSDMYAFGVVLYSLATGFLPFSPESFADAGRRGAKVPPPIGKRSSTWPFEAFNIVNSCLALDRSVRPKTAAELRNRLAKLSSTPMPLVDESESSRPTPRTSAQLQSGRVQPPPAQNQDWTATLLLRLKILGLVIVSGLIIYATLALRSLENAIP